MAPITASMLYNHVACPHRVSMDSFGDPKERDPVSPFVQLLWERGAAHEQETIRSLGVPYTDLSAYSGEEKERRTLEAIARGDRLIYAGRISDGDLLGEPDLLRRESDGYIAGDIKSGAGEEGADEADGKPKLHYAVQVALYTEILEQKGLSVGRRAFIWDIKGDEVAYDLTAPLGIRKTESLWDEYKFRLAEVRDILAHKVETRGAYSSTCKQCHWYTACLKRLEELDDLTLIPELGRSKRDAMIERISTVSDLAATNPAAFITKSKTVFKGIGADTLVKLHERARLLKSAAPKCARG